MFVRFMAYYVHCCIPESTSRMTIEHSGNDIPKFKTPTTRMSINFLTACNLTTDMIMYYVVKGVVLTSSPQVGAAATVLGEMEED